jgi:hypothetical protein
LVLVAFLDAAAQRRAMHACDNMMARFWPDVEFEVHWSSFSQLADATKAREAAEQAAGARIVIVSTEANLGLPPPVRDWMKGWCGLRRGREGTLIGLVEGAGESQAAESVQRQLRTAAHEAGLDYLTHEPDSAPEPMADDMRWIDVKCQEVGSVLGHILEQSVLPPSKGERV